MDSTQVGGMQDQIMAMLKKQFEKTYILTFNKEQSLYKEEESLAPPSMGGAMVLLVVWAVLENCIKTSKSSVMLNKVICLESFF